MMRINWKDIWIYTLIDAGISPSTARGIYQAKYGNDGPDFNKNPAHEAVAMLEKIGLPKDDPNYLESMSARHSSNPLLHASKVDL